MQDVKHQFKGYGLAECSENELRFLDRKVVADADVRPSTKPAKAVEPPSAHQRVSHRDTEATKRLTLDIPASLHACIKAMCALHRTKMVDEIRELLERYSPADGLRT